MKVHCAIIGVGGIGEIVLQQLTTPALSKICRIVSLSNSKHSVSISPGSSALSAETLRSLLPSSKSSLPSSSSHPGVTYSPASTPELVKSLVASSRTTKTHALIIDCTSDIHIAESYPAIIASGLSVVTPNKKGFSSSNTLWEDILAASEAPGAGLFYHEATVGAGLPVVCTIHDLLKTGDEIIKVEGILSGTLSYLFNNFSQLGERSGPKRTFSEIVKYAKDNGYTEPQPADDLAGTDVARKLTILTRLISASPSSLPALPTLADGYKSVARKSLIPPALEGITSGDEFVTKLKEYDSEFDKLNDEAAAEGEVLRYVGVVDRETGTVTCGLERYPAGHPFAAALTGSHQIIAIHTQRYASSPLVIQGAADGELTAMGVVADVVRVSERVPSLGRRMSL